MKRLEEEQNEEKKALYQNDEHYGMDEKQKQAHYNATKIKNISKIQFGEKCMPAWYYSPYPEPYHTMGTLYICEYCLNFFGSREEQVRHCEKCDQLYPPGNEIYRNGDVSVFEVDPTWERLYCENLCLLSKLYLDHKNLYYDIEPFLFYVITEFTKSEKDEEGVGAYHFVGYFSKEKKSEKAYNLACIFVLPKYQRNGYGKIV